MSFNQILFCGALIATVGLVNESTAKYAGDTMAEVENKLPENSDVSKQESPKKTADTSKRNKQSLENEPISYDDFSKEPDQKKQRVIENAAFNELLNEFAWKKAEEFAKEIPVLPFRNRLFINLIYEIVKRKLVGDEDYLGRLLVENPPKTTQDVASLILHYVIAEMEILHSSEDIALKKVYDTILNKNLFSLTKEDLDNGAKEARRILLEANVSPIIIDIDNAKLLREFEDFFSMYNSQDSRLAAEAPSESAEFAHQFPPFVETQETDSYMMTDDQTSTPSDPAVVDYAVEPDTHMSDDHMLPAEEEDAVKSEMLPDYTKALTLHNIIPIYNVPGMSEYDINKAVYGVYTTRMNYAAKYYVGHSMNFSLPTVKSAKNMWDILGMSKNDMTLTSLGSAMENKLMTIAPKYNTKVISFEGTCQDAIIENWNGGKIAVVSFANGQVVGGGSLAGKLGQEELLVHCVAGLYESLLENSASKSNDSIETYKDVFHSPEVGLYTTGAALIKRVIDNKFHTIEFPVPIDIISSAAINFAEPGGIEKNWLVKSLGIKVTDPYEEVRRRIRMQFAMAIINGAEVLITGLYNCGAYNADKQKIAALYKETLNDPLFKNKLKTIIFAAGDMEPYSDFKLEQHK